MTDQIVEIVPAAETAPEKVIASASERAGHLTEIVRKQGLFTRIGTRDYLNYEAWSLLARFYNLIPTIIGEPREVEGRYIARAGLRDLRTGEIIAEAESQCGGPGDGDWPKRAHYARQSMAETRACSKVCRVALSWVAVLGGFQPTPAEEIGADPIEEKPAEPTPRPKPPAPRSFKDLDQVRFGAGRGKKIPDLTDDELEWHVRTARQALQGPDYAPGGEKHKFLKRQKAWLAALEAELKERVECLQRGDIG